MLLLLQPDPKGDQAAQLPKALFRHVIIEAPALTDQVRHVGGVLLVVLVPAPVQHLSVPCHGHIGDINDVLTLTNEVFSQRLMVGSRRLQPVHSLTQAVLVLEVSG